MKSIFLLGTDTSAGKTHASAALMLRYEKLVYWKAVQTGFPPDDDAAVVEKLTGLDRKRFLSTGFTFKNPLSPHRAAELENRSLTLNEIIQKYEEYSAGKNLLVEGAGGLLVPVNREETWLDFLLKIDFTIVLAARTGLGTINHTLLTLKCLAENKLKPAGVIFCGKENEDNVKTIEQFSGIPSLGQFYYEEGMNFKLASEGIDSSGIIESVLENRASSQ